MNQQQPRTMQETRTTLDPAAVLAAAKVFFSRRNNIYAAFLEKQGPTYVSFRGQGGEELIIGAAPVAGGTRVTGSTYLFDQQIARFFSSLPPLDDAPPNPAEPVAGAGAPNATAAVSA
ncbi:MAG TPA: hypothetical protein VFJ74_01380 [Gemmatimonadaceae bacterium]|nr:hypothetical protein [Gemmatimonadaceae bacterium]